MTVKELFNKLKERLSEEGNMRVSYSDFSSGVGEVLTKDQLELLNIEEESKEIYSGLCGLLENLILTFGVEAFMKKLIEVVEAFNFGIDEGGGRADFAEFGEALQHILDQGEIVVANQIDSVALPEEGKDLPIWTLLDYVKAEKKRKKLCSGRYYVRGDREQEEEESKEV